MADDTQDNTPAEETQAEETQVEETPAEETSPSEEVQTEEAAPAEETQTEEAPVEEAKEEAPAEEESPVESPTKKPAKEVSKDLEAIIEKIEKLSVLELADLVHALEDRFGVTAAAPMAVAAGSAPAAAGEAGEEQTTFNVVLTAGGANKIAVIKAVRELVPTLGLKEAKDLVEGAPKPVLEGVNKETANEAKTKLTAAGGTVELQ